MLVPAGTVHTIGEGLVLAEIQQASNVTFRIDDWGRLGADGKPRELHLDEALACIDFERGPVNPVKPRLQTDGEESFEDLVSCPYFDLRRRPLLSEWRLPDDERFRILMPLHGRVMVRHNDWHETIGRGDTLLIPACLENVSVSPAQGTGPADPSSVLEVLVR